MPKKKQSGRIFLSKGVSIEPELYQATVQRAAELRMRWSEYVRRCLESDLSTGGDLKITPKRRRPGDF